MASKSPPAPLRKPATLDHLRKKPQISRNFSFCIEDLPEPQAIRFNATDEQRADYEKAMSVWRQEVEASTVEGVIRSLPRRKYADLIEAHPPTEAQLAEAKAKNEPRPDNNQHKFGPALLEASIVEPAGLTIDDAQLIWDEWPNGEVGALTQMCLGLNHNSRIEFYQSKSKATQG